MLAPEPESESSEPATTPVAGRRISPLLIIAILSVLGVSSWACFVWVNSEQEFDFRRFTFQAEEKFKLCPVDGVVYFNDKLITHGHVEAHPVRKGSAPRRIVGAIKEDGKFELYSEIRGKMGLGVPVGEYKLLLMVHHPATGFGYPAKLFPTKYYEMDQTPITVSVVDRPEGNHIEVRESGELNLNSATSQELDNNTEEVKETSDSKQDAQNP